GAAAGRRGVRASLRGARSREIRRERDPRRRSVRYRAPLLLHAPSAARILSSGSLFVMPTVLPCRVGRYALFDSMASGGTARGHLGRLFGTAGFARTVCIKRLHPQFAKEAEFVKMLLDEARIAARIRHPNVVSIIDVVSAEGEVFVVMEYVPGQSLARLVRI